MNRKVTFLQRILIAIFTIVIFSLPVSSIGQTVTLYETTITTGNGWVTNTSTGTSSSVTYSQNNCVFGGGTSVTINTAQARCAVYTGEIGLAGSNRWMDLPALAFTNNAGNTSAGTLSVTWYNNGGGRVFRYYLFDVQGQQIGSATVAGTSSAGTNGNCTTYEFTLPPISGSKVIKISTNGNSSILAVTVKTYSSGTPPTVTTTTASAINATGAGSGGDVTAEGSAAVTAKGVVWNTAAAPTVALPTKTNDGTGLGAFTSSLTSLTANTKYYYRAYGTSSAGTGYGSESNFTTLSAAPVSNPASNITLTSFNANWSAPTQGPETFTYTLEYSTDNTFTTGVTTIANINSSNITQNLSSLTSGGTYYYRVYAVNVQGTSVASATQSVTLVDGTLATDHFRSAATGNWNAAATWESSHDGTTWTAATSGPDDQATAINVRNGHTVTVTANVSADDLTIETGANVEVNAGVTFTIANGAAANDVIVNGTLKDAGTLTPTGTVAVNSGGMYDHAVDYNGTTVTVPAITWNAGSTLKLSGVYSNTSSSDILLATTITAGTHVWFAANISDAANGRFRLLSINAVLGNVKVTATGAGTLYSANADNTTGTTVASFELTNGNFHVNRNGGATNRALTITGDLTVSGGVFDLKSGSSNSNGQLNVGGNINVTAGSFTKSGTGGTGTVTLNGTGAQTLTFTPTGTINYMVNKASGTLTLGSDLPVNGSLTFTAGNIITGSNKVIIASTGSMVNAGTNGWIAGNLQKNFATGASVARTFEIGDASAYRPVSLAFSNVTVAGDLIASVSQSAGDHSAIAGSGLDAGKTVNRYWSINNTGVDFDQYEVTFTFLAADLDAGANTAAFIVKRYNGLIWSATTAGTRTATTTQATGITSFSDFVIGEAASAGSPPTVSTQPNNGSVCVGSNTLFNSASLSTPAPTIQWERSTNGSVWVNIDGTIDGGIYSNFNTETLNITGAAAGINGYLYRAVFTNVNGSVNSNEVTITVDAASDAGTLSSDQIICIGNSPANITASGTVGSVVRWESASDAAFTTPVTISNTTTTLSPGALTATTYYRIVVKSGACTQVVSVTPVTVTVNSALQNSMALAGTSGGASVCNSHDVAASPNYFNNCDIIATVTPAGGSPVTGNVNACVKIDASVSVIKPYVPRTYVIEGLSGSTATLTLYFMQSEFNAFNAANGSLGDLPTNGSDAAGKANMRISIFTASSHTPGASGEILYDPNDADITFNSAASRWEVIMPVTFASGNSIFVHTNHWPLPVSLIDFSGEMIGTSNKLIWSTATESNNKGFEVERSADGKIFSRIGFVSTKADNGNSNATLSYQLIDEKPFAGNSYYRLKQIDRDGKYGYSKVILLSRKTADITLSSVYPNPSVRELNVMINSPKAEKITLVITDLSGKIIIQRTSAVITGMNQQTMNIDQLSSGTYLIKIVCANGCESAVYRFVKQ